MVENMRIHFFYHASFEGPGAILSWAKSRGHTITETSMFRGEQLPDAEYFDWLIVMGGPMGADDELLYPWLASEKEYIKSAITKGKTVLGVCLGAQILAKVLGGRVYRNEHSEIGWFPVRLTPEARNSPVFKVLPGEFVPFHWHGDTFTVPQGGVRMAESNACALQAFACGDRVYGLQFHLESTTDSISAMIRECSGDLKSGEFIQKPDEMLSKMQYIKKIQKIMHIFLDRVAEVSSGNQQ
ncbi:MAG: type 1 glutamine amidotransferase [Candidatus Latescibacter sp.]|nr:type 1 glutamine amidotransferase [Candidatus Latescibacter sp.]